MYLVAHPRTSTAKKKAERPEGMLSKITLKNIQTHEDLTLEFGPGLNVIHGSTDSGKTAVLRGLLWAALNDGNGDKLLKNNNGAKECSVELTLDGHTIRRSWSKSANTYSMDGVNFSAFRTSVPAAIAEVVNMDAINVQRRRDVPFMVYWKATDNAQQFSQMLDIDEIDRSINAINKDVREGQQAVNNLEDNLLLSKQKLDALGWVDEAMEEFKHLEALNATIDDHKAKLQVYTRLYDDYRINANAAKAIQCSMAALEDVTAIIEVYNNIVQLSKNKQSLSKTCEMYTAEYRRCTALKSAEEGYTELVTLLSDVTRAKNIMVEREVFNTLYNGHLTAENNVTKYSYGKDSLTQIMAVCVLAEALPELRKSVTSLQTAHRQYQAQKQHYINAKQLQERTKAQFNAAMPDVCPLCGSEGCKHQ